MAFSSLFFLCAFLPLALAAYYACPKRHRNWVALAVSLLFYSWGAPRFVAVLVLSSLLDYVLSKILARPCSGQNKRKLILSVAVSVNVLLLGYFKYMNFFVAQAFRVMDSLGMQHGAWLEIALPIGISFITFQKLSYLLDVYRGVVRPAGSFQNHLLYISLFPQLIAGPIVRYHDVAHQIAGRTFGSEKVLSGFWRFSLGLAKKVLIANVLGDVADSAFSTETSSLSAAGAWLGALCYSFQIYFDFSGYSDMAIGLGRMLGFDFLENFNLPYISASFSEFWRRWHISLSNWMKEYLYIPLGGNRRGKIRNASNLWVVFLLSGLWHGASWHFVVWGAYHGFFLSMDKFTGKFRDKLPVFLKIVLTFILVTLGWVIFRAESLPEAWAYIRMMFIPSHDGNGMITKWMAVHDWVIFGLAAFFSFSPSLFKPLRQIDWKVRDDDGNATAKIIARTAMTALLLVASFMALVTTDFNPFIYFRF